MILAVILYACSFGIAAALAIQARSVRSRLSGRVPLHFNFRGDPQLFADAGAIWMYSIFALVFTPIYIVIGTTTGMSLSAANDPHPYRAAIAWGCFSLGLCIILAMAQRTAIDIAQGIKRRINMAPVLIVLALSVAALATEFITGFGG
ncbi:MAG: hypothetical protein JO165_14090 [Candidatus Eremiobacteraeota bacterium]|nr:hypothetical protein [Candidatus Eremiobacteraeota bacterium]